MCDQSTLIGLDDKQNMFTDFMASTKSFSASKASTARASAVKKMSAPSTGLTSVAKDVHNWYMGFTSIGGLSQFANTDLQVSKVLWFLLFVAGLIMTIVNFTQVIKVTPHWIIT